MKTPKNPVETTPVSCSNATCTCNPCTCIICTCAPSCPGSGCACGCAAK